MSALFGRQVLVEVGVPGQVGRRFSDLRVTFQVKEARTSTPRSATVDIYNPNPDSIAAAQQRGAVARVFAGYDLPRLIFQGDPVKGGVRLDRRGPDRILHLELQDSGRALAERRINVSFATPTTARQVYDAVAAQLGLPAGTIRLPDRELPHGVHLQGRAAEVLDRLARSSGADWFVRDGAVQFVGRGEDTGETALVISSAQGNLIGSPAPKEDGAIEVVALLDPSMRAGIPFVLDSLDYRGTYVARSVDFDGDTHGAAFYMRVTGAPR